MARVLPLVFLAAVAATLKPGLSWLNGFSAGKSQQGRNVRVAMRGGKNAKSGIFSPLVEGAKGVMGAEELTKLRGEFIKAHGNVIAQLVDTSESKFGKIALKKLFEAADKDGSGSLDREEVKAALQSLGFQWMEEEKKVTNVLTKADADGDEEIDFEEFAKTAPKVLRQNLVKLAKQNGNDLGFLV